jgi:hypothetical protein
MIHQIEKKVKAPKSIHEEVPTGEIVNRLQGINQVVNAPGSCNVKAHPSKMQLF